MSRKVNKTGKSTENNWLSETRKKYLKESKAAIPGLEKILGNISREVQFSPQGSVVGVSIRYRTEQKARLEPQIINALEKAGGIKHKEHEGYTIKINDQDVLVTFGAVNRNP